MDRDAGIDPWAFDTSNPGYVWLLEQQAATLSGDLARDTSIISTSVGAGSVNSSKTYRTDSVARARTDLIETAISIYESGQLAQPRRTVGAFGLYLP